MDSIRRTVVGTGLIVGIAAGLLVATAHAAMASGAPDVEAGGPLAFAEGENATIQASFSDPDAGDTHTAQITWGDGSTGPGTVDESAGIVSASHAYAEEGVYTVTVQVTDSSFLRGSDSVTVTVANVAPTVNAGADHSVIPGRLVLFTVTYVDPGGISDTHTATVDWGDGIVEPASVFQSSDYFTVNHVYPDLGTYTVTVTVTDDEGDSGSDTLTVTVFDPPPVVPDQVHNCPENRRVGERAALVSVTNPDGDPLQYSVLGGTGQTVFAVDGTTGWITVADASALDYETTPSFTLTVQAQDPAGGKDSGTVTIVLTDMNEAPVVDAGAPVTVLEGETAFVQATYFDQDAGNTHTAQITWGDLTSNSGGAIGPLGTVTGSYNYANDGVYTVTVSVSDQSGAQGRDELTMTVVNVAPTFDVVSSLEVDEGTYFLLQANVSDPGLEDGHSAAIDWGDGTTGTAVVNRYSRTLQVSHLYASEGTFQVTLIIRDDGGGSATDTFTVSVVNVPPIVTLGVDREVNEGTSITIRGVFYDPQPDDVHTAQIAWGDGSTDVGDVDPSQRTVLGSHVYRDSGVFTVTHTVTDDSGGTGSDTLAVTVANVPPVVEAGGFAEVAHGTPVTLSATVTDAGAEDTHVASVDWGDGVTEAATVDGVTGAITATHLYSAVGLFMITVTAIDDDGAPASDIRYVRIVDVTSPVVVATTLTADLLTLIVQLNDDDLILAQAANPANYAITAIVDTTQTPIPITSIAYDASTDRITITAGSILYDALFQLDLDGDDATTDGTPGLTDVAGNHLAGGDYGIMFDLRPLTAVQLLIVEVLSLNLPDGAESDLVAKLEAAAHLLEMGAGNQTSILAHLTAFLVKVEHWYGLGLISQAARDDLAATTTGIVYGIQMGIG